MGKTQFNLIPKAKGDVSYEHCAVQRLHGDIYIGDAERNYFVDKQHEINLCVHYNFRIPGKYAFISEYRFYVTDGRQSLFLHCRLGEIDPAKVIEEYTSLELAAKSEYYKDFYELKEKIDNEILRQQEIRKTVKVQLDNSVRSSSKEIPDKGMCTLYEIPHAETKEFVQFHIWEETGQWQLSTSHHSVIDEWRYLNDFYQIEETELHLLTYRPMKNTGLPSTSVYYQAYLGVKQFIEIMNAPF